MMFRAPVLFLLLIVACAAAPTTPRTIDSDPEVARRWYSIPEDHEVPRGGIRPWPLGKDGSRTVTYCFTDVHSYHALDSIFELGLAKWEPAMRLSTLKFAPDPACPQEPCLCDEPDVAETTLHDGLAQEDRPASASVGYEGLDVPTDSDGPRNSLLWPTDDPFFFGPYAPLLMAHELG